MDPVWLTGDIVLALHDEASAEFGGMSGVRDTGSFENALAKPRNLIAYGDDPSLFDLSAAYCIGIAKNHPFVDGNKRTAFLTAAVFLELNGYLIAPSESEVVEKMIQVAEGKIDQESLAVWFKRNASKKRRQS
jgi:death on curing protein